MKLNIPELLTKLNVSVRKSGLEYRGHCPEPQHRKRSDQRGPGSWQIRPDNGFHHCFACGWGGGPLTLVRAVLGLDSEEARRWLREFCGYVIPDSVEVDRWGGKEEGEEELPALLYPKAAIKLWTVGRGREAHRAVSYLKDRGVTEVEILYHRMFAVPSDSRDRYRGRVIVPVIVEGRLVDFVARLYVKSPPTIPKALSGRKVDGARKELAIWNFDRLDPELPMVYVTEGIWGALSMIRLGVRNVVAICGSAWSEERSELLGQWPTVVLVPDGDRAGEKLERVASKSLRRRSQVQVVRLPPGGQPDEIEPGELLRRLLDPDSPRCSEVLQCAPSDWAGKD